MAKRRRLSVNPVVRGIVRGGVRAGATDDDVISDVQGSFPGMSEDDVKKILADERRIQGAIESITQEEKRKNVDLARRLKCPAGTSRIRVRITITYTDPLTGAGQTFGDTVEIDARGRLQDLLNDALGKVIDRALAKGYQPPLIRSSQTSGSVRYRIERMDCV